jgi:hypothetical protein
LFFFKQRGGLEIKKRRNDIGFGIVTVLAEEGIFDRLLHGALALGFKSNTMVFSLLCRGAGWRLILMALLQGEEL